MLAFHGRHVTPPPASLPAAYQPGRGARGLVPCRPPAPPRRPLPSPPGPAAATCPARGSPRKSPLLPSSSFQSAKKKKKKVHGLRCQPRKVEPALETGAPNKKPGRLTIRAYLIGPSLTSSLPGHAFCKVPYGFIEQSRSNQPERQALTLRPLLYPPFGDLVQGQMLRRNNSVEAKSSIYYWLSNITLPTTYGLW